MVSNLLIDRLVNILREKDFNIAAQELEKITDLDSFGSENFLHDIILERWVYRPEDVPFTFARDIWQSSSKVEDNRALLKEVLQYPIADINRAKINDFLWVAEKDFSAAKSAEKYYRAHVESTEGFDLNFMAINRLVFLAKKLSSKETDDTIRKRLLIKVMDQYDNEDHGRILYLIQTAMYEKVDTDYLIQYTEKILNTCDDQSYDFYIIGEFCDVLEQLYYTKNKWQKKRCVSEPKLIEIRRRKAQAILTAERTLNEQNAGNLMRSVHLLKDVVNLLKTITGTEAERKEILKKIDAIEKKMISEMPVFSAKHDNSETVKQLIRQLEVLDKEEALCYFALFIPLPEKSRIEESVTKSADAIGFGGLFPVGILGKDGKSIAKSRPIKKSGDEIDSAAFQESVERRASEFMGYFSQIMIGNTLHYIRSKFKVEEKDIREIVENSIIVPEDRREAYVKGLMAGFSGDFLIALSILVPQVENSVRELALECGEPVYNLNEDGIEEIKTMHAVLELDGVREHLDEDFLLALKTVFCSKFGFNMRNDIAHGLLSDKQFQSFHALYTWWFILKICYMFCGKLQVENRIKVNDKLRKLFEGKNEDCVPDA